MKTPVRRMLAGIALLLVTFAVLHLAGIRGSVGWLSGTLPDGYGAPLLGAVYVLAWFGVVIVVPIVLLALVLDAACGRIMAYCAWRHSRRP